MMPAGFLRRPHLLLSIGRLHRAVMADMSQPAFRVAAQVMVLAMALREGLQHVLPQTPPFVTLLPAIAVIGVLCGPRLGMLATAVGALAADFLWMPPRFTLYATNPGDPIDLLLFPLGAALILGSGFLLRTAVFEARYARALMEVSLAAAQIGSWEFDPRTGLVIASGPTERLHGLPPSGRPRPLDNFLAGLAPEDRRRVRSALQAAAEGAALQCDYQLQQPNAPSRWISLRGGMVGHGRKRRLACALVDLTDRIEAENATCHSEATLRASQEQLFLALQAAALGVWRTDLQSGLSVVDARAAGLLGLPEGLARAACEQPWRPLLRRIHPHDRAMAARAVSAAVPGAGNFTTEFRVQSDGGAICWLMAQGMVQAAEPGVSGGRIIGVMRDITHRRLRENALQETVVARELLVREADHRIKNSLQLVISLLTVQMRNQSDPAMIAALQSAVARVNAVAASHQALYNSHNLKTVDFAAMLRELCRHFAGLAAHVTLECLPHGALPLDADRAIPLSLMVSELVTNALRHAFPPGRHGRVTVDARTEPGILVVIVTDDGIGMPTGKPVRGMGSTVVRSLAGQISAKLDIVSSATGTQVTLRLGT